MSLRAHKLCPYPLGSILIIRSFCKHQDGSKPPFTFSFTLSLLLSFHFSFLYFCGCLSSQIYLPSTLTLYHHSFPFCPHSLSSLHSQVHSCSSLLHCPLSYPLTASSLTAQGGGGFLTTLWGRQGGWYSCWRDEKPGIFQGHVAGRTRTRIHVWESEHTALEGDELEVRSFNRQGFGFVFLKLHFLFIRKIQVKSIHSSLRFRNWFLIQLWTPYRFDQCFTVAS